MKAIFACNSTEVTGKVENLLLINCELKMLNFASPSKHVRDN